MRRTIVTCVFLLSALASYTQNLEDEIYHALDKFVANTLTENSWSALSEKESEFSALIESKEAHLALVILQCNLGYYANYLGKHQQAIDYYQKASEAFAREGLQGYDIIAYCLIPLGNLYTVSGDYTNAENTIKSYLFLAEDNDEKAHWVSGMINLSVVYHNTGNHQTAIRILQQALSKSYVAQEKRMLLINNLATNLLAIGQADEAQSLLTQNINAQSKNTETYTIAAQIALVKNDFELAEAYLNKAEVHLLAKKEITARETAKFYVGKSKLLAAKGDIANTQQNLSTALRFLLPAKKNDSLPLYHELYPENTFIDIFDGMAALQERYTDALNLYDMSFHVSELLMASLHSQEAKILNQAANRRRSEKCVQLLFEAYQVSGDEALAATAFHYAELGKASVLKEMSDKRSLLQKFPEDTILLKSRKLRQEHEEAVNRLVRSQLSNAPRREIQELIGQLNRINSESRKNRQLVSEKYADVEPSRTSLEEVNAKLKKDKSAMVLFFYGRDYLYQIVSNGLAVKFEQIPLKSDLKNSIAAFIAYFDNPVAINADIEGYKTTAFELYKRLNLPLVNEAENVLIIPDGLLSFIPFEALLTEENNSFLYHEMPFLVKQHGLFYNVSASYYYHAKATKKRPRNVLGVFPVFEDSDRPLKHSLNEAEALKKELTGKFLMREEATKANFTKHINEFDVLHLSTHAGGGSFSIPAHLTFIDSIMLIYDLYALDIDPQLVVLSACETGVGKLQKGEGAMSIARGFQYAGAQNLLLSLWQVNDLATARLMEQFYKHYGRGLTAFSANRKSKLDYLEDAEISNAKKSPYYWASFAYYGSPIPDEPLHHFFYVLIALFGIIFTLGLIYWQRNQSKIAAR